MKNLLLPIFLFSILLCACKEEKKAIPQLKTTTISKVTSIDELKNGKPFINYLGEKLAGC